MEHKDTIHLLKECDAGSKMAVTSIDEVLEFVEDEKLKELLSENKAHHEKLGNETHELLSKYNSREKDPNIMAKGMSWLKTNVKLGMDGSDETIADLITDGCDMGVKSLNQYLNEYSDADKMAKDVCKRLIKIEEDLRQKIQSYL